MYDGIPNIANNCSKHEITVLDFISLHGNAKGNLEYSSTSVSRYLLGPTQGSGPLKSMLSCCRGWVALIRFPLRRIKKVMALHYFTRD